MPETRFARADGADIAYQVFGDGPVDLLWVPGWISHLEVMWELAEFARFLEHLGSFARVVTFDKRGTGMSDRVEGTPTIDERVDDVRAVLDAADFERAVLVGWFDAAAILAVCAVRHPDRVQGLVCGSATVKFAADPGEVWGMNPDVIARAADAFEGGDWGLGAMLPLIAPSVGDDERLLGWWRRYERMSATPSAAAAMLRANQQIDVRDVLPQVHAPTLVLHRRDTVPVTVAAARQFAAGISGATFRVLPGSDVFPYLGDQDSVLTEIEEFVTGVRPAARPDRFLATIVFTDIVGSTDIAQRQGDARWRGTLGAHDALAERLAVAPRRTNRRHRGRRRPRRLRRSDTGPRRTHGSSSARFMRSGCRSAPECTRARLSGAAPTSPASACTSAPASVPSPTATRFWSAAPSASWSSVRRLGSSTPGSTELKGVEGTWHLYALDLDDGAPRA